MTFSCRWILLLSAAVLQCNNLTLAYVASPKTSLRKETRLFPTFIRGNMEVDNDFAWPQSYENDNNGYCDYYSTYEDSYYYNGSDGYYESPMRNRKDVFHEHGENTIFNGGVRHNSEPYHYNDERMHHRNEQDVLRPDTKNPTPYASSGGSNMWSHFESNVNDDVYEPQVFRPNTKNPSFGARSGSDVWPHFDDNEDVYDEREPHVFRPNAKNPLPRNPSSVASSGSDVWPRFFDNANDHVEATETQVFRPNDKNPSKSPSSVGTSGSDVWPRVVDTVNNEYATSKTEGVRPLERDVFRPPHVKYGRPSRDGMAHDYYGDYQQERSVANEEKATFGASFESVSTPKNDVTKSTKNVEVHVMGGNRERKKANRWSRSKRSSASDEKDVLPKRKNHHTNRRSTNTGSADHASKRRTSGGRVWPHFSDRSVADTTATDSSNENVNTEWAGHYSEPVKDKFSSTWLERERLPEEMEKAKKMTIKQLKEKLNDMGVPFKSSFKKKDYVAAYAEAVVAGGWRRVQEDDKYDDSIREVTAQKYDPRESRFSGQRPVIDV